MVFSSGTFLFFFLPAVLVLYFLGKSLRWRNTVLMISSVLFYAWGEPLFVFVMLAMIFINWFLAEIISKTDNQKLAKALLTLSICVDVLVFFLFKYLNFFLQNVGLIFNKEWGTDIALPIGISFFTFQIMSYVIDVYRKTAKSQKNPLDLLLYISMFPQLIAGPIVRYETIANELVFRETKTKDITIGVQRFVIGLAKKTLIANYVAIIADNIFSCIDYELATTTAWIGAIAYTFQIYFDFSGYSDMAIGLGRIFGFHFDENFDHPYIADSITNFWRRWHISLSSWFRDYVYIPLGGNRVSKIKWIRNLLAVWLLTGIWHGANWTFIAWGLYYFVFLILEKNIKFRFKKLQILNHIYTIIVVIIGWVLFRSVDITHAWKYIMIMFGGGTSFSDNAFLYYIKGGAVVLICATIFSMPIIDWCHKFVDKMAEKGLTIIPAISDVLGAIIMVVLFAMSVITNISSSYNPFIYFNF